MPTIYAKFRKIRCIKSRLENISRLRTKKIKELRADYDRQLKMLPKYLWISSPTLDGNTPVKARGTYCLKKHGMLK